MKKRVGGLILMLAAGCAAFAQSAAPRIVDLKAADGTPLKATYFAAARPGPGVLLLHQINRLKAQGARDSDIARIHAPVSAGLA